MSSLRHHNHRRRSHSASPSSAGARTPNKSFRVATKRAYPHLSKDASPPQKWDVDAWRRGKRRRQDIPSPPLVLSDRHPVPAPPNSIFPTKASDFHLTSRKERDMKIRRRSNHFIETHTMDMDDVEHIDTRSLSRLRSNAFWELRRSVAENGEGLVRRMRDYEHSRSRTDSYLKAKEAHKRGRKRSSVSALSRRPKQILHAGSDNDGEDNAEEEEDDDVQIFAGEMPRISLPWSGFPQKRSLSLDGNGAGTREHRYIDRCCSSSVATYSAIPSKYHSDDETLFHSSSGTTSPIASLCAPSLAEVSLSGHDHSSTSLTALSPPPLCNLTSASRTEKAIAALSLAMAGGAGGITDYDALAALQVHPSPDECQVGEMWH